MRRYSPSYRSPPRRGYSPPYRSPPRRGYSPSYRSPPRRGYGGRGRSPPPRGPSRRRGYDGYGGRREPNNGSLLVRNIPLNCRSDELRVPFERFGPVRDVYLPKDYYTGEPRGFGFIQFVDPFDSSEAQYHMNGQIFGGRELTVVVASETRKRPDEMRHRDRGRGPFGNRRRSYYYGRSRSPSRSRSPRRRSHTPRRHSRSYSPAPKRHGKDYSRSPERKESSHSRSRSGSPRGRSISQEREREFDDGRKKAANGYDGNASYDDGGRRPDGRSPGKESLSPPGSRSRSVEFSSREDV